MLVSEIKALGAFISFVLARIDLVNSRKNRLRLFLLVVKLLDNRALKGPLSSNFIDNRAIAEAIAPAGDEIEERKSQMDEKRGLRRPFFSFARPQMTLLLAFWALQALKRPAPLIIIITRYYFLKGKYALLGFCWAFRAQKKPKKALSLPWVAHLTPIYQPI